MIRKRYVGAIAALWTACAFTTPQEIIAINFGADRSSLSSGSDTLGFVSEDSTKGGTTTLDKNFSAALSTPKTALTTSSRLIFGRAVQVGYQAICNST